MKKRSIKKKGNTSSSSILVKQKIATDLQKAINLHQAGNLSEAKVIYQGIQQVDLNNLDAIHLLGLIEYQSGNSEEAITLFNRAMGINPNLPDIQNNLGLAFMSQEELLKAINHFKEALRMDPGFVKAYFNLGNVFKKQKNFHEAVECYNKALSLAPDFIEVCNNLGNVFKELGNFEEALKQYRKVISLRPDFAEAYNNIGAVLDEQDKLPDAFQHYKKAVQLDPGYSDAYYNLGNLMFLKECKINEAIEHYQEALRIQPDFSEAHFHKGLALLLNGNFEEGWPEYIWRFGKNIENNTTYNNFTKPLWDGSSLAGKRIVISSEQGAGDCIQFIRYLPLLKNLGAYIIFECYGNLLNLFDGFEAIDLLVEGPFSEKTDIQYDFFVPLLCLPSIIGTNIDTIVNRTPYIESNPELAKEWGNKINTDSIRIGLVWEGTPTHNNDRNRSFDLSVFGPLTSISGVSLFSLQKEVTGKQSALLNEMNITALGDDLKDFSETAAAIENLDLLISVDTAVVHLAGAMEKPVWTLLPFVPDWRWLLNRDDSPWYPTMRLFRQTSPGDWESVINRISNELQRLVKQTDLNHLHLK